MRFLPFLFLLVLLRVTFPGQAQAPHPGRQLPGPKGSGRPTIYFLNGLGTDPRVFQHLTLPRRYQLRHLEWPEPKRRETLDSYCRRIAAQIDTTTDFVLVGFSFGGMVAVEMNKFLRPRQTILISSIATGREHSGLIKTIGALRLHRVLPVRVMKAAKPLAFWFFNARTPEEKELVGEYIDEISPYNLRWGVNQFVRWQNTAVPANLFHLHGRRDRVFSSHRVRADVWVPTGRHMMLFDQPDLISRFLQEQLEVIFGPRTTVQGPR